MSPARTRRAPLKLIAGGAALAVCGVLAFLLLGSGGTQLGGPVAQAATVSSSAAGYRMHMSLNMSVSGESSPITATGSGVVDLRDNATLMSLAMNLGGDSQVTQQLGGSTMRVAMITKGDTVYVQLPAAVTAQLPTAAKQWIEVDLAKLSGIPGLSSLASNPTTSDPSQMLKALRSESGSVVDFGPQRVDGVQTTHYQAALDFSRLVGSLPSSQHAAAQQALSNLQQVLPSGEIPVDVWIDANHLVRRIGMSLDLSSPSGPSLQETVTVDLSHYGPQSPPATPPADQVLNLSSSLAGALGGALGGSTT